LAGFLNELVREEWDSGDENFPPTHCQVTNIHAGTGAENVTPGHAEAWFNFRNSPASPIEEIRQRVEKMLKRHGIRLYDISWKVSGDPFLSKPGALRETVIDTIREELGLEPELNTGGGTSDGRFIAPLGSETLELGLINASIHKVDENTPVVDLELLSYVYLQIMRKLLTKP
jgi:succinyl-diaminopimelate desuccinylase